MVYGFRAFLDNIIIENLHPELKSIVAAKSGYGASTGYGISKQSQIASKIRELTAKGESTGIEGNMPKGSSRAYLQHKEKHDIVVDGEATKIETGTKVAISGSLEKHHQKSKHGGLSLGAIQNKAEHDDNYVNNHRVLTEHHDGTYKTNHDGIFPPLLDADKNHEWSHVGHARDVSSADFRRLTKSKTHPKGISHKEFSEALIRNHRKNIGRYWEGTAEHEAKMDHIDSHPLVQNFNNFHDNVGTPPDDYSQKKNMGIWKHPHTGKEYIVARDHGYNSETQVAYRDALNNRFKW